MPEQWCELDQRFFNPTEWKLHLQLCNAHSHAVPDLTEEEEDELVDYILRNATHKGDIRNA